MQYTKDQILNFIVDEGGEFFLPQSSMKDTLAIKHGFKLTLPDFRHKVHQKLMTRNYVLEAGLWNQNSRRVLDIDEALNVIADDINWKLRGQNDTYFWLCKKC